jgi:uncharacterized protein YndB with AHSA1/START domain
MTQHTADLTVRKSIEVAAPVEHAWAVFTGRMGEWWPFDSGHSLDPENAIDSKIEPGAGGRCYEIRGDGSTAEWGTVEAWEPPSLLVLTWTVSPERPTRLEVRFTGVGEGTRVELVHSGWEDYVDGAESFASYDTGWDHVLGCYVAVANA